MNMGWNKGKAYDRGKTSMRGVSVREDTSCLRENRSEWMEADNLEAEVSMTHQHRR